MRRARPADAAVLARLQEDIYGEGRWFVGDRAPSAASLRTRLQASEADPDASLWLVADVAGDVAGWSELHRLRPARLAHVANLTVAVAPRYRRAGWGRRLLRAGYAWAERVGVLKIRLDVRAGNSAAIALYRSEGFVEEGRERAHVRDGDDFEDNVLMARWLTEAPPHAGTEGT